jgi:hypothetical protein
LAVDAATLDPTFPADESTQYRLRVYADNVLIWTGDYNAGAASVTPPSLAKIVRECVGLPALLRYSVTARHNATYEALQDLSHEAGVDSALADDDFLGICDTGQLSVPWTAPANGDYDFILSAALAGDLQAKVNGGVLQTVISAGNTTGTLTGVVTSDIIEIRHTDAASSNEVLLAIDAPGTTEDAYACLIFENVYWQVGGFGRLGFGTGKFGR